MSENILVNPRNSKKMNQRLEQAKQMHARGLSLEAIAEKLFGCSTNDELAKLEAKAYTNMTTFDLVLSDSEWASQLNHKKRIVEALEEVCK